MSGITVTLGYGKANLSTTLATYACMKVDPPFTRVTAITSGKRMGQQTKAMVGNWEHTGVLLSTPVEHPAGTIILLQVKWMRGPHPVRDGSLFLRLRSGAAVYSIAGYVPTGPENILGDTFQLFQGPADIMNVDELRLLNIDVPRGYHSRFMDEEELAECFRIIQVSNESVPRPAISAIATPEGIEMREVAQEAPRRLRLRGRRDGS